LVPHFFPVCTKRAKHMHRTAISAVDIHSQTCLINASNVAISRRIPSHISRHFPVNESPRSMTTLLRTLTKTAGAAYCVPSSQFPDSRSLHPSQLPKINTRRHHHHNNDTWPSRSRSSRVSGPMVLDARLAVSSAPWWAVSDDGAIPSHSKSNSDFPSLSGKIPIIKHNRTQWFMVSLLLELSPRK